MWLSGRARIKRDQISFRPGVVDAAADILIVFIGVLAADWDCWDVAGEKGCLPKLIITREQNSSAQIIQ